VQEVSALEVRLEAAQERVIGSGREMVVVDEAPLRIAVIVALESDVTVPAVAVKPTDMELAGTVTDAGTVRVGLLEERVTVVPPAGAALDSNTKHEVLASEARLDSAH
jgi:hypothetical protein